MAPNRIRPERSRLHELLADPERRVTWEQLEAVADELELLPPSKVCALLRRAHQTELDS